MWPRLINCFIISYLRELSHSNPSSFSGCFLKLAANFGLVPPLVAELAVRRMNGLLAGTAGGHLRDKPLTPLPGRVGYIRRLPQAPRITDNLMAVSFVLFCLGVLHKRLIRYSSRCFLAMVSEGPNRRKEQKEKLRWRMEPRCLHRQSEI